MKIRSAVFCWFLQRALIDITQPVEARRHTSPAPQYIKKLGFDVKECKSVEIPALHLGPCLCG